MHLKTALPFAKSGDGGSLSYRLAPTGLTQRRFARRLAILPQIDLSAYQVEAVVDWLRLGVELGSRTQFMRIQRILAPILGCTPHVRATGGRQSTNTFVITIQDPRKGALDELLWALAQEFGLLRQPEVDGLEVSVDWRPKSGRSEERRKMVGLLQRHFLPKPEYTARAGAKPRTCVAIGEGGTYRLGDCYGDEDPAEGPFREAAYVDGTYYVGARKGPAMWRVMDKVTNKRIGAVAMPLPPRRCSARIEVTLGAWELRRLGIKTLEELRRYGMERLRRRYFRFWIATMPMRGLESDSLMRLVQGKRRSLYLRAVLNRGVFEAQRMDLWRERMKHEGKAVGLKRRREEVEHELQSNTYLVAYYEMNERVRHALRRVEL